MQEYESRIIKHPLYWEIRKGRRTSVGNRWLSPLWPTPPERHMTFTPRYAYLNHIGPGDVAGQHFHHDKQELFCPMGDLWLILSNRRSSKKYRLKMSLGTKWYYTMYYIPPGVAHAVHNRTKKFQPLAVLTNTEDIYGQTHRYKLV